ncbi:membrane-bound lytic murein transglycosylase A [Fluviicoccus keumensis]|uniref:Membrane-bound lytic murein transglycosylase A n=1 Tax=Fluviicoccus keumensis TaxID=1435465 RepID=A0A4Q7YID0_9GAMM|nr:MltA domain-containing protein [Fluviicoccus keumensis]RZU36878.1 membrane-bound lytic murein transglycosylase A [Fluviicoccus keumensis]
MRSLLLVLSFAILAGCVSHPVPPVVPKPEPGKTEPVKPEVPPKPEAPTARYLPAEWIALPDWPGEKLLATWPAWLNSCKRLASRPVWKDACAEAVMLDPKDDETVREFFERRFSPWRIESSTGAQSGLITGYYEPLLTGGLSAKPGRVPFFSVPEDLLTLDIGSLYPELKGRRVRGRLVGKTVTPYWSRADISSGKLTGNPKVLAWADDAVEAFFMEVQGSGRIKLDDGSMIRLGYADQNGHPYKSIGRWLVDQGELTLDQASMQSIRAWAAAHPERLQEMLNANPSQVFFRILPGTDGPIGALNVPLTDEASVAIDPKFVPLGTPLYLATTRPNSGKAMNRMVHAQDTGGAIAGPIRADFFWGFGDQPGELAGKMKQQGQIWLLWPKDAPLPSGGVTTP